jgi:hypothetical protein
MKTGIVEDGDYGINLALQGARYRDHDFYSAERIRSDEIMAGATGAKQPA